MVIQAVTGQPYEEVCHPRLLGLMGFRAVIDPILRQRASNGGWTISARDHAGLAPLMQRAFAISVAHMVTIYDALYVALAEQRDIPLVTMDQRLVRRLSSDAVLGKRMVGLRTSRPSSRVENPQRTVRGPSPGRAGSNPHGATASHAAPANPPASQPSPRQP